jgi:hypothetical protein
VPPAILNRQVQHSSHPKESSRYDTPPACGDEWRWRAGMSVEERHARRDWVMGGRGVSTSSPE